MSEAAVAPRPAPTTPLPAPSLPSRLSARMRHTADGTAGVIVVMAWAVAEAFVFPLIPDSGLAGMAFASPRRARRLWLASVVGTVVGSVAAVWLARQGLQWPLPLVTDRMAGVAQAWIVADGAGALVRQPLSGVPVKAFNATGAPGASLAAWAFWVALARGGRMAVTAAVGAGAGWLRDRVVPERHRAWSHVAVVAVATMLLLAGLASVVAAWS